MYVCIYIYTYIYIHIYIHIYIYIYIYIHNGFAANNVLGHTINVIYIQQTHRAEFNPKFSKMLFFNQLLCCPTTNLWDIVKGTVSISQY